MILSCCIITSGDKELEFVQGAITSIQDVVSEIILVANQQPHEQLKAWSANNKKIKFFYKEWTDSFADQRNFAQDQVRQDADYYVWLDSDDVVIHPEYLPKAAEIAKKAGFDVVFFDYWYGNEFNGKPSPETYVQTELLQKRERLIDPRKIRWHKRLHETPVPIDGANFNYSSIPYSNDWPIVWMHLGGDRDMGEEALLGKMNRNKRLLEMELAEERQNGEADPRTLLYLMKIYAEFDEPQILQQCVDMGREYVAKSGWDQERSVAYRLMAQCMGKLNQNEQARDLLVNAIKEYPYDPLLYLHLARVYFNLQNYRAMKHWMDMGVNMPLEDNNAGMTNILELKVLSSELLLQYSLQGEKNTKKAWEAAKMLNKVNPSPNNEYNVQYLFNLKDLDETCGHIHQYFEYLIRNRREHLIEKAYEQLPDEIKNLPFAVNYYNRYKKPKTWASNEICYFANFGGAHFEKWDGTSLKTGLGGSETAVIRLSEEWAKKGWKVTVYGDPFKEGEINGVYYAPWYKFNSRDHFNIFIQWRHSAMADKVNAKKFLVDLHDVFFPETHWDRLEQIDRLMVKSKYHRSLGTRIAPEKFSIVPNGL